MVLVTVSGHFIIYFLRLFLQFKGAFINYMIVGMSKNITILPMSMLSQRESNHINTCRVAKCSIIISRKLLMFPLKGNFKLIWALL